MNILYKTMIVGATVFTLGSSAWAAPAPESAKHHEYAATKFDPAKRAERFDARQQKLHDALKLTANQESAWTTYIGAIKPPQPAGRGDRVSFKELNTPQRMEKLLELSKARVQHQETRLAAVKTFYATLTPAQQKIFDEQSFGGGKRHHGPRRGG